MYFVPNGTKECGYYECKKCGYRFLSLQTMKRLRVLIVSQRLIMKSDRMNPWKMSLIQQNCWRRSKEKKRLKRWIPF